MNDEQKQQIAAEAAEEICGNYPATPTKAECASIIQSAIERANPLCESHQAGMDLSGSNECPLCRAARASEQGMVERLAASLKRAAEYLRQKGMSGYATACEQEADEALSQRPTPATASEHTHSFPSDGAGFLTETPARASEKWAGVALEFLKAGNVLDAQISLQACVDAMSHPTEAAAHASEEET